MRCLVVGGAGFIGWKLVAELARTGRFVRILDQVPRRPELQKRISYIKGSMENESAISRAMDGCDTVFHLACAMCPKTSNDDPIQDIRSNVLGTLKLLNVCVASRVHKLIFVSSGGTVYGIPQILPIPEDHPTRPICSYGISKLAIEKYLHLYHLLHGLDYSILRLSNAYGEGQDPERGQGAIAAFLWRAIKSRPIEIWGDGSVIRDYVHVDDIVRALVMVSNETTQDRIFNVGSGRGTSLKEIINLIQRLVHKKIEVHYKPPRSFDVPAVVLDIQRIQKQLGWTPQVSLMDGLKRATEWLKFLS